MENYSLSDLAAVTGSGNTGFGGAGGVWLLIILFFLVGFGGGGFGNRGEMNQYATAASQQEILFGQQFQGLNSAINKVGDGLSSLGYAQLQQMDANTASINGNITSEGRALQSQLANCCCENLRNTDAIRYDMAQMTNATQAAIHSEGEQTRALIQQNKIEQLQAEVNSLKTASMFSTVPRINPYMYNVVPNCGCGAAAF